MADACRYGAHFVLLEIGYGAIGGPMFRAAESVIDWGAVRAQMWVLHGR